MTCALNLPFHSMPGDSCPTGHHVVSKLDAIDAALRDLLAVSGSIRFLGIVPFINPSHPSVRIGSNVFFSMHVPESNATYARIVDFAVSLPPSSHVIYF